MVAKVLLALACLQVSCGTAVSPEVPPLPDGDGYFGRMTGNTSIEVTGGHAGGSEFNLPTRQRIIRIGVLGYMKYSAANGTLAIYKDTGTPDIKQLVCHTVTGALPVGPGNKGWTVLEVAGGPVWLDAGDYWIIRNDSGDWSNKFVITGQDMGTSSWGWCYIDYPDWPDDTEDLSWTENYSDVEGCFYAEWGEGGAVLASRDNIGRTYGDERKLTAANGSGNTPLTASTPLLFLRALQTHWRYPR